MSGTVISVFHLYTFMLWTRTSPLFSRFIAHSVFIKYSIVTTAKFLRNVAISGLIWYSERPAAMPLTVSIR